jgi:ribosomal protein L16 Arg81 hydroxylase
MNTTHDLARLIAPVDPETFKRDYWERRPLVIRRQDREYYQDLLSLAKLDHLLTSSSIRAPAVRVLHDGKEVAISTLNGHGRPFVTEALFEQYRRGATIALNFLHERSRELMELCQSLACEFSANVQVNTYLTPPNEQGLATHYDTHDVFVLQVEGVKHWRLYNDQTPLPLAGQPYCKDEAQPWELLEEFDLHPGDAIYLPRGFGHDAVALGATSLHMTVGIVPVTWATVLIEAVEDAVQRNPRFRTSLPLGFANNPDKRAAAQDLLLELVGEFGRELRPAAVIDNAAEIALQSIRPSLEGHLLDLSGSQAVHVGTRLSRRTAIDVVLGVADGRACLRFHGKEMRFPAAVEQDLKFVTAHEGEFTAAQLPGNLDDPSRLTLLRRLIIEGLVTICTESGGHTQQASSDAAVAHPECSAAPPDTRATRGPARWLTATIGAQAPLTLPRLQPPLQESAQE